MGSRKRSTPQDGLLGQHLALSVAAHLARTQLVPDPLNSYDAQHLLESVTAIANALVRVTPLYVAGANDRELRQLGDAELQGARVDHGATSLVLRDGRTFASVSIKRGDLRQAIAILKNVGIPELATRIGQQHGNASKALPPDRFVKLRADLDELEELLRPPLSSAQSERANRLAIAMARSAPDGRISNLAMLLVSAVHDARNGGDEGKVRLMLARLRSAVEGSLATQAQRAGVLPEHRGEERAQ